MPRQSLLMAMLLCAFLPAVHAFAGYTERISVSSAGVQADGYSQAPSVSGDGRFVAFSSGSGNLVPGVADGQQHVFVRDRATGTTECVSLGPSGEPIQGWGARLSSDGKCVAFNSEGPRPMGGSRWVVYLRDREQGATELISVNSSGQEADGDYSWAEAISSDGQFVLFSSVAYNLDPRVWGGLYVRDRSRGTTELVNVNAADAPINPGEGSISADGRVIAWDSHGYLSAPADASGAWTSIYVRDRMTNQTEQIGGIGTGPSQAVDADSPSLSGDGRLVVFLSWQAYLLLPGPRSEAWQVFLYDRAARALEKVGLNDAGEEPNRQGCLGAQLNADGRFLAFSTSTWNTTPQGGIGAFDVFIRDRVAGRTQWVSVNDSGQSAAAPDELPRFSMSADGRVVAFESKRSDVVPGDTNEQQDIFAYDRLTFLDVPVDYWAYYDIEGCLNGGVVSRTSDRLFHPSEAVTRDVMASFIARAMAGGDAQVPEGPATPSFPDVHADNWAYKCVEYARAHGIVTGYRDGFYHPERTVDRGQMAVFIARAMVGGDAYVPRQIDRPVYFPDLLSAVPSEYYKYIEFLAQEGVVKGYPDRLYHPELTCTRDQIAVYLARVFRLETKLLAGEARALGRKEVALSGLRARVEPAG